MRLMSLMRLIKLNSKLPIVRNLSLFETAKSEECFWEERLRFTLRESIISVYTCKRKVERGLCTIGKYNNEKRMNILVPLVFGMFWLN